MTNTFVNTIVFVRDIEISKDFYSNLLGMKITRDEKTIVFYENGLVLHSADSILKTVHKVEKSSAMEPQGRNNILLYFETDQLDQFHKKIGNDVKIIHGIEKQAWGQNVFRFYDPDGHMVEFGEPLAT